MKIDIQTYKPTKRGSSFRWDSLELRHPFQRINDKQKEDLYREFATLINSGVDYNQALTILSQQQRSGFLKSIYEDINAKVIQGLPLHEAMRAHKSFSPYEFYSIKIGEDTKRLPEIFKQLQLFFSRRLRMRRQVVSVLAYPVFVLVITFAVLYFMLNFVVPMFASVFQQFGRELPEITKFVVNISDHFNVLALSFFGFWVVVMVVSRLMKDNRTFKGLVARVILGVPFFGSLVKKIHLARFCQSMSLLLSAKTPLITALELTDKMISFYPLKSALADAKKDIMKGEALSQSLARHPFFTPKLLSLTKIGEQVNELDRMYDNLARQYNDDVDHSSKVIGTILEPVMIIIIGGIVGFIMVAMYSPIFNLSKVLEN